MRQWGLAAAWAGRPHVAAGVMGVVGGSLVGGPLGPPTAFCLDAAWRLDAHGGVQATSGSGLKQWQQRQHLTQLLPTHDLCAGFKLPGVTSG